VSPGSRPLAGPCPGEAERRRQVRFSCTHRTRHAKQATSQPCLPIADVPFGRFLVAARSPWPAAPATCSLHQHYPASTVIRPCPIPPAPPPLATLRPIPSRRTGLLEACSGFTRVRPIGLLSRPRRPLSRGSSPPGHPAGPLVSYQINRQLSGWIPPPLVIRAFGAHCQHWSHRGC
jgi:hypothetical protein